VVNEPKDASIYVGDQFVGNTPASLQLSAGNHLIVVRSSGSADWIRFLTVLKGSQVTLRAVLVPSNEAPK
jgi:hypothetical protein